MSQTLQNQLLLCKSMNGIITFDDGAGTLISDGVVSTESLVTDTMSSTNLNAVTVTATDIFSDNVGATTVSATNIIVPRINTGLTSSLGADINLTTLVQNFTFDTTYRIFKAISDNASTTLFTIDFATNFIGFGGDNLYTYLTTTYIISVPDMQFRNAAVSFAGCTVTFNSNLPTSTLTPTADSQLITKKYADDKFTTLSGSNAFTGTNTFNSYLPTSTIVPTTDYQLTNKLYVDTKFGTVPVYVKNDANTNSFLLGSGSSIVTTGYYNFSGGNQALNYLTTGYLNVGIGQKALYTCQTGTENFGLGSNSLYSLTSGSFNTAIGVSTGGNLTTGISNTFIGRYSGGALSTQNNNTFVGYFSGVNSTGEGNTIYGAYTLGAGCSGSSNTIIGFSSGTISNLSGSNNTIIGSSANLSSATISNSCAIGTGAIATASNQIMLGRATESVQVPGTLQVSSVSAISSTITVNNNIIHKKYYLSMVNPTVLTGTSPLTMSAPIYEYNQLNLASGIVNLPLSSEVEIGTVIRFRRITTMTGAISLQVQTGSGQAILGRNSVSAVSISTFLAANVTYGSVVFLSSNLWAITE